jgi:hypothetical protein
MLFMLSKEDETERHGLKSVPLSTLADAGWSEKDLENILAERIDLVLREDHLMVISQERHWQEEADILAVDEKGTLYIFELKRWESDKSNLLQVIRYGQIFGQYSYESLQHLFRKYVGDPERDLAKDHRQHFELGEEGLPKREFNNAQQFIVVTAGIDVKTLDAITYWRQKGLPLMALTYHVYKHGENFFLEFHSYSPQPEDYIGLLSHDFIVNTNVTYMKNAYEDMLSQGKASAYYSRKSTVDKIQRGDRVFLYHTGVGVCGMGRATDNVQSCAYEADEGEEHYVPLKMEIKVDPIQQPKKCVSAWEINQALGTSHRFRLTAFSIDKEMGDKIEELFKQKYYGEV